MQRSNVSFAKVLLGDGVFNTAGDSIGKVEELIIDAPSGRINYAIVSYNRLPRAADRLFAVPWSLFNVSPARDHAILSLDEKTLEAAPAFERGHWPDFDDSWEESIHKYYGTSRAVVSERVVYVEREGKAPAKPMSAVAAVALTVVLLGALWATFLISTRGWDQAKNDMSNFFSRAAYAMKETSQDAALTAKVKTALSLSKRIPANAINVDSQGDVVTLRGEVASDEIRNLAASIAQDTPGVGEVHNHLYAFQRSQ